MSAYVIEITNDPGHDMYWNTHLVVTTTGEGERDQKAVEKALQKPRTMMRHLHDWADRTSGDLVEEADAAVAAEVQAELARRGIVAAVVPANYVFATD